MTNIKCPHCHEEFSLEGDEKQVVLSHLRDEAVLQEVERQMALVIAEKDAQFEQLRNQLQSKSNAELSEKEKQIHALNARINEQDVSLQLKIRDAQDAVRRDGQQVIADLNRQIQDLHNKLSTASMEKTLAVNTAVSEQDRTLVQLRSEIQQLRLESELEKKAINERHTAQVGFLRDEIERLKNMRVAMSTKMVGETLEQHCENEFNKYRSLAFPRAYFEKDNQVIAGSKGDYIFREMDDSGIEIVSIMFEMKNEMDSTATKKKNEDFFKELDKDREAKGCEYAILVSMLESDSELYNTGIVDVSHRYPKMFVIRPQFFIQIISLLRSTSMKSLDYRKQLDMIKRQNVDVTDFEEKLLDFKVSFSRNYELASKQFLHAVEEIDKSISHMQKVKESLLSSERNLRIAQDKSNNLSVKRLIKGNPTMTQLFEDVEEEAN